MKIKVQYQEGSWMEKLVFMRTVVVRVERAADGRLVHVQVPALLGKPVPF